MKLHYRGLTALLIIVLSLFALMPATAQDDAATEPPSQIDLAIANLAQRLRVNITLGDLTRYEWQAEQFPDASLGCPSPGEVYAQVVTPGWEFELTYDGTIYEYHVSDSGDTVVLCDTRLSPPIIQPTATPNPPTAPCGDTYTINEGDTLYEIATTCGTSVASLLIANPGIDDPSLIFPDVTVVIPDEAVQRGISIRPDSGMVGSLIRVFASGFPAGAQVDLGIGRPESEYDVVGTREIANDGELDTYVRVPAFFEAGEELVVVLVLDFEETVSETFTVTEGEATPEPTPTEPASGEFTQTQIYLVAIGGDASRETFGCGDSLIPVTVTFEPTVAPLTAALEQMFAIDERTYGRSGLYNALYQSDLTVEGIDIEDGTATINLSGDLAVGGVCDEPRIMEQIEQTALQYSTIDTVEINLNRAPLEDSL